MQEYIHWRRCSASYTKIDFKRISGRIPACSSVTSTLVYTSSIDVDFFIPHRFKWNLDNPPWWPQGTVVSNLPEYCSLVFKYRIVLPDSLWSIPMLFHLLVISIYKISTEAIEKLLLLSLQFLLRTDKIKKFWLCPDFQVRKNSARTRENIGRKVYPCHMYIPAVTCLVW